MYLDKYGAIMSRHTFYNTEYKNREPSAVTAFENERERIDAVRG